MRDPSTKGGFPLALWASTTCPENATATPLDLGALTSPYRTCFVIDSITMLAAFTANMSEQAFNLGETMRCRFTLGHIGISQDWIPIWGYGPRLQSSTQTIGVNPPTDIESTVGRLGAFVGGQNRGYSTFLWRLPKPLIVAPGMTLIPSLQRGVDGMGGNVTVEMGYLGRSMPADFKVPAEIAVPFVSRFLPPEIVASNPSPIQAVDPSFVQSQDRVDLTNPLDIPLHMVRLIYRTQLRPNSGSVEIVEGDNTTINILTSNNRKLVDNLQANIPFDRNRMAWNVRFDLPPGENITLQIPKATRLATGGGASFWPTQYTFSAVGWRVEKL